MRTKAAIFVTLMSLSGLFPLSAGAILQMGQTEINREADRYNQEKHRFKLDASPMSPTEVMFFEKLDAQAEALGRTISFELKLRLRAVFKKQEKNLNLYSLSPASAGQSSEVYFLSSSEACKFQRGKALIQVGSFATGYAEAADAPWDDDLVCRPRR